MSNTTQGFVKKVFTKSGNSKRGPWVADSFKLEDVNGNEDPYFYQVGFRSDVNVAPGIVNAEGKFVEITYEDKDASARTFVSGKILGNQPERAAATNTASGGASAGGSSSSTQQNIHYQNSRTAAIELVGILLDNKALPHSATSSKAGQAKAFDEITAAVDKLTVQYFNDLETFRLFDRVSDAGDIDVGADGDLPDDGDDIPADDAGIGDEPL